jgi:thioredoxin 1
MREVPNDGRTGSKRGGSDRVPGLLLAVAAVLAALAMSLVAAKCGGSSPSHSVHLPPSGARTEARPRLVDVGANKCIPCKAMAPILEQLRADFADRLDVEFVDVWVNPDAGVPYGIRMIPTQIFYGADGRELSRHEGFMSREDILARWKSHGVTF